MKKWVTLLAAISTTVAMGMTSTAFAGDKEDDKTITFWNIGTAEVDHKLIQGGIDEFSSTTSSGYDVDSVELVNDKFKEKLVIAMSSGECPDMYNTWTGGPMIEYINSGYAQPIDDLIKKYGIDKRVMPAALEQGKYNGHYYAIPMTNISVCGIYYNKKIFEEVGIDGVPTTLADLEEDCDKIIDAGYVPFALANSSKWTGSMYYQCLVARKAGLEPFQKAAAGEGSFEDEVFVWAGEKIQDWVKKGYFPEGFNSMSADDSQDESFFFQGKAAMYLTGSWESAALHTLSENAGTDFYDNLGWFNFPAIEGSEVDPSILCGSVGDLFVAFNCTGEKLDAAVELASCYSDDNIVNLDIEIGNLPPVIGVEEKTDDPLNQDIIAAANNASSIQLWWDQYLPPEVASAHLDGSQEVFGLTMTPEEAAKKMEEANEAYLNNSK